MVAPVTGGGSVFKNGKEGDGGEEQRHSAAVRQRKNPKKINRNEMKKNSIRSPRMFTV